jgi:hypothetical protein
MECTSLNLLTRDGALGITFTPALTPDQYSELLGLAFDSGTADEMSAAIKSAAGRWGAEVVVDLPLAVRPSQFPGGRRLK